MADEIQHGFGRIPSPVVRDRAEQLVQAWEDQAKHLRYTPDDPIGTAFTSGVRTTLQLCADALRDALKQEAARG